MPETVAVHAGAGPVAMVTGRYPLISLTFIDREVRAMRALGVDVTTVTVRSPDPARLRGEFQIAEAGRVVRLLASAVRPRNLFGAMLDAMRRPVRLASAVRLAVDTCPAGLAGILRQAAYLFEAIILARHLEVRKVVHIHNHLGDSSGTVTMLASVLTSIPYSMTLHGPEIFLAPKQWRLDEKISRAHAIFCVSVYTRGQAMLCCEPRHWRKIHLSRCGVELERYQLNAVRPAGRNMLFVGRLDRRKGVHVLLEAVAILRGRLDAFHLTVVGDGPESAWMERKVAGSGLASFVTFTGALDETRVAEALRRADLLVAPGLAEGLPVVLMEALASGVPAVASAVGGVPELIRHGETGLLVQPGDQDGLADAMARMLANPDLRRSMGEAGRELVRLNHDARLNAATLLARLNDQNFSDACDPVERINSPALTPATT